MRNSDVGILSGKFLQEMNVLIYHDVSADKLNQIFLALKEKYRQYPKDIGFIKIMDNQKEKVCKALKKVIFTFGNTSTQRGEGTNSWIKVNGNFKAWLANSDLVTLHDYVQDLF